MNSSAWKEIIALRGKSIAYECAMQASPPPGRNGARVDDRTEMSLLNYLMPQQRPRMPVRKILTRSGGSIQALKPCFMMGPQAVAQYLTPGVIKFDLVIMDEAVIFQRMSQQERVVLAAMDYLEDESDEHDEPDEHG